MMIQSTIKGIDPRLNARYIQLVNEHMNAKDALSPGAKALPNRTSSFASTQAAWRFYKNPETTLVALQAPLLAVAQESINEFCQRYALCVHDWSRLRYDHANKRDTFAMTHQYDVGYDLQSSLIVSDVTGLPLAPVAQCLYSADGRFASYDSPTTSPATQGHLDELTDCLAHIQSQAFSKPLVHLVDRESDSVAHLRRWQQSGALWLIRSKDAPKVEYDKNILSCKAIADLLTYSQSREVIYKGKKEQQWLAETQVVITRPAKPSQKKGYKPLIPGEPLSVRLVVSRIISKEGKLLAQWLLLSNVDSSVTASELALWYYWRWKIESFFKLMKSAGHDLENWQQESVQAISKRMLVASMACVAVWQMAADKSQEAANLRQFLVKLSGRQLKRSQEFTNPALLAGLWVYLSMLEVMDSYSPEELGSFKTTAKRFLLRN